MSRSARHHRAGGVAERRVGFERRFVAWSLAAALALLLTGVVAALVGMGAPSAAGRSPFVATVLVAAAAWVLGSWGGRAAAVSGTPVAAAAIGLALGWRAEAPAWLVVALAAALPFGAARALVAPRLPRWLEGEARRQRALAWTWVAVVLLALASLARLGSYLHDPSWRGGAAVPTAPAHSCLTAYLRAGELALANTANLYDPAHYEPQAGTLLTGASDELRDPFQYPPPALLVPSVAVGLSHDVSLWRSLWFAVQATAFLVVALLVALRAGGPDEGLRSRRARTVLWTVVLACSLPVLTALEYGQAHLMTLALAMAGMLAFERGRDAFGGALLGAAISIKIFPALLVVHLLFKKRMRAVLATLLACAAYALVTLAWLGTGPFEAFFSYQLPRLASGEAFATFVDGADFDAVHMGVPGVTLLLEGAGLASARSAAGLLTWIYSGIVLVMVWLCRRRGEHPAIWLALLGLGAARSLYAPASYGVVPALWLLALWIAVSRPGGLGLCLVAAALVLQTAPFAGNLPLSWSVPGVTWAASLVCLVLSLALQLGAFVELRRARGEALALRSPRTAPSVVEQDI